MKGRDGRVGPPPSADLLVCFPTRSHLTTLMPKPICSPARAEPQHRRRGHRQLKRSGTRRRQAGAASPLLWAVTKPSTEHNEIAEPTSPKVTCAGQIKVRNKTAAAASGSCKNWQSVMEEIERIHNHGRRSSNKGKKMGFKKEVVQFLACLRGLRFDFRCFGSFPGHGLTSEEDEDDEEENVDDDDVEHQFHRVTRTPVDDTTGVFGSTSSSSSSSRTVFSKWFNMVWQEKPINQGGEETFGSPTDEEAEEEVEPPPPPPPNALLLMRCRSAPAKRWVEKRGGDEEEHIIKGNEEKKGKSVAAEDEKLNKDNLVVMRYDPDLYPLSSDIAKETWIVGGGGDQFSRSRSWNW